MHLCPMRIHLYVIRPGDSLQAIASRYNISINAIVAINPEIDFYNIYAGQIICIRPGHGYYNPNLEQTPMKFNMNNSQLKDNLRILWEQHVVWARQKLLVY